MLNAMKGKNKVPQKNIIRRLDLDWGDRLLQEVNFQLRPKEVQWSGKDGEEPHVNWKEDIALEVLTDITDITGWELVGVGDLGKAEAGR